MAWRFSPVPTGGRGPEPRSEFASAVYKNELFVVGGWNGVTSFGDAFALQLDVLHWRSIFMGSGAKYDEKADSSTGKLKPSKGPTIGGRRAFAHASSADRLYMHGGQLTANLAITFDDMLVLNLETGRLERQPARGNGPGSIARHAMAYFSGSLWVFGGERYDDGGEATNNDRTYRLRLETFEWERVGKKGEYKPWHRSYGCLIGLPAPSPYLILHGGADAGSEFDDVDVLDSNSGTWVRVLNQTGEEKRQQMACVMFPPAMRNTWRSSDPAAGALGVMGGFGGKPDDEGTSLRKQSSFRILPFGGSGFRNADGSGGRGAEAWAWTPMRVAGSLPAARMAHAMHLVNESFLVVFGGNGGVGGDTAVNAHVGHRNDVLIGGPNADQKKKKARLGEGATWSPDPEPSADRKKKKPKEGGGVTWSPDKGEL